ncbi:ornithine--oxo-acid transaminase [Streptomyces shenzhenensis]|uniref:ornithine--oxo-acid transaminase n=1 Tax=Streptomyces shenzhenensis TaxID=943815 RepID=UPI0033EDD63C
MENTPSGSTALALEQAHTARNYAPLPVVISQADGAWVTDTTGVRYFDCLAGYSALNFGHRHPRLVQAAVDQLSRVTLTSRAFHHDQLGAFCAELADLTGTEAVLPMNTGAEAVESALKIARKWGYEIKGVPENRATIVVADGNFHGRTTSIISFSGDKDATAGFGPYTPGFRSVPFGDTDALADAIDATTVAVLIEPIQGEAGVVIPPDGYLRAVRHLCTDRNVLFVADEIQSGLARTGRTFACDHEDVRPDLVLLGKALGGGILPVSAVVGGWDVLGVLRPGQHGSTFGGNPLGAAVGRAVIALLRDGSLQQRAQRLGEDMAGRLDQLIGHGVTAVRSRGLWAGVDIDPAVATGRQICERLMRRGVLAKETHGATIRLAPPIIAETTDLTWAIEQLAAVLDERTGQ